MDYWYIFISFIISNVDCQMVGISVYPESIDENKNVTLTCTYNGTVNEIGVKWFNGTDTFGWIYDTSCTLFSTPGPSYDGSRIVPECNDTDNVYKLNIRATKYDHLTQWCCAFTLATDVLCTKAVQITLRATTSTSASTTTTNVLCKPDGPLFVILDICIIISYIIMDILIIDLIFWNKNLTFPVFKPFVKRGHQYLRILYLVLLITVVVCEISIIIMIIIGRQCEKILIVGLCLGLVIITVSCIFLIVFIKTEVNIHHKDTIRNPKSNTDVKITVSLRQIFISDVEWIGPKGNKLTTEGKCIITPYNSDTGETSLTIKNVSQEDNGSYFCQSKNGCKIAKDSIHILCDTEKRSKNTGPPAIHIGTQNKVEPKPTSKQTNERPQPFPPVGGVVEDKLKRRPQPPPPENIDAKDRNLQRLHPNYEDAQDLPTGTPPSNRLTPLTPKQASVQEEDAQGLSTGTPPSNRRTPLTPKQATVQEEDASNGTKKKRKKKKKKGQMNLEKQEEGTEELRRILPEDEADKD